MIKKATILALFGLFGLVSSFNVRAITPSFVSTHRGSTAPFATRLFEEKNDGVIELADEEEETKVEKKDVGSKPVAPFLSQGEISEEAMAMDLSDPKQARVMGYIILSLLPVLFLIPLMLGSRDMIPADILPPVELN